MKHYVCDFETYTAQHDVISNQDLQPLQELETAVYKAAALDYDDPLKQYLFDDIDQFMTWVIGQPSACFDFHNLGKFDGPFIIDWLVHNGYPHLRKACYINGSYLTEDGEIIDGFFTGRMKSFTFYHGDRCYNFLDTTDIILGSIRSLGYALAEDGKADLLKGETPLVKWGTKLEEYTTADGTPWTQEMLNQYILNDVRILREAMRFHQYTTCVDSGIRTAATLASVTMLTGNNIEFRQGDEPYAAESPVWMVHPDEQRMFDKAWETHCNTLDELLTAGYTVKGKRDRNRLVKQGIPNAELLYPVEPTAAKPVKPLQPFNATWYPNSLNSEQKRVLKRLKTLSNNHIRKAYKGGFNWVNPVTAYTVTDNGYEVKHVNQLILAMDINSMYPWVYSTKPLPRILDGAYTNMSMQELKQRCFNGELLVAKLFLKAVCPDNKVPFMKPRTDDPVYKQQKPDGYASYSRVMDHEMTLTSPELKLMFETYDVDMEESRIDTVYTFKEDPWLSQRLADHCAHWMEQKRTATGSLRMFAKLQLNSPYGKLGQLPQVYGSHDFMEQNGKVVVVNHVEHDKDGNPVTEKPSGRPDSDVVTAAFITAYGRVHLAESINMIGLDKFLYCDTDSMHVLFDRELLKQDGEGWTYAGLELDDNKLGAWKVEGVAARGMFIKPKTYGEAIIKDVHDAYRFMQEWIEGTDCETEWRSTCAGFSRQIDETEFKPGGRVIDKRNVVVKGGTLLLDYAMQIGDVNSYFGDMDNFDRQMNFVQRYRSEILGNPNHELMNIEMTEQMIEQAKDAVQRLDRARRGDRKAFIREQL